MARRGRSRSRCRAAAKDTRAVSAGESGELERHLVAHFAAQSSMHLAMQLSDNCAAAHNDIRALGLAQNTGDKLARLLVNWSERTGTRVANGIRMTVLLKHEEIAQMIGATRETVTRTLSDFRRQKLIEVRGSTFIVADEL